MIRPPSTIPDKKEKPKLSHEDVNDQITAFFASGKTIEVIESRPASPVSKASQTAIF